jgi:hypothetical protein
MEPAKKGEVLCSHCSLIAHSKCAGRAALTCDLRSKLLIHAQFAERGSSPAEFITRLPNHHPASASSSRGSFERERANSPTSSSPHPPVAYKVLSPFKRSRASITPDPTQSNSSGSLAAPPPKVIPEGSIIRRLSLRISENRRNANAHAPCRSRASARRRLHRNPHNRTACGVYKRRPLRRARFAC